jgi:hypothetical protein
MSNIPAPSVNAKVVFDSARPAPRRSFGGSALAEAEPPLGLLDQVLRELGYDDLAIGAAKSWLQHRHTIAGCPAVRSSDWFLANTAALDPAPPPAADLTPTPWNAYRPSADDARWAAEALA